MSTKEKIEKQLPIAMNAIDEMDIQMKDHCIFVDGKKVSNFTIRKLDDDMYEIDNGKRACKCHIPKIHSLYHFRLRTIEQGSYFFEGNTKQLNAIVESLGSLGFQAANGKFHFNDRVVEMHHNGRSYEK